VPLHDQRPVPGGTHPQHLGPLRPADGLGQLDARFREQRGDGSYRIALHGGR
jgi:hypothetical protein